MNPALEAALVTLIQVVVKLQQGASHDLGAALDEIDLSDEGFEEELHIVKQAIKWQD
jgi:hypothetical protein